MKNRKILSIAVSMLLASGLLPHCLSFGADLYVRAGAKGLGVDWENALGQIPSSLQRGNTYFVADGVYRAFTIDEVAIGSKYIKIKKATVTDHGTDRGWKDSYGDGVATFQGTTYLHASYIDIDGQYEYGFKFKQTNCNGDNDCISSNSAGTGSSWHYIKLKYCELEQCGEDQGNFGQDCLYIRGDPNSYAGHWLISHCYFHDTNVTCILTRWVNNTTIEYSTFARRHTKGTRHGELISWNSGGLNQHCVFRYNIMYDSYGTGMLVIKDASSDQSGWKIYGNVFYQTSERYSVSNGAISDTGSPRRPKGDLYDMKVFNNTFVNIFRPTRRRPPHASGRRRFGRSFAQGGGSFAAAFGSIVGTSGNEFKNNICYNTSGYLGVEIGSHNLWNDSLAGNDRKGSGQLWKGGASLFKDYKNHDFRLAKPTKPADDSIGDEYAHDIFGNLRGADGTWDRGAFEYNAQ